MEIQWEKGEINNCEIKLRQNPLRRKAKIRIGCGAGFAGDRPAAALKLLQRVDELDYLVLECLAERTLADRYQLMAAGQKGYDPRRFPLSSEKLDAVEGGMSTYLGAAPIVQCLERYEPDLVITSRVADAALFLAPMVYELGWNWNEYDKLAKGSLAGHLLECGCQLTGGYFVHPGDNHRDISFEQLLDISLPFSEINYKGEICVAKADGSGGLLNLSSCAEQLLYEVGDPASYITPDVVLDLRDVYFCSLSDDRVQCDGMKASPMKYPNKLLRLIPMECGWKGWGEISYGGYKCLQRAEAADFLVRSWMDEYYPGVKDSIFSYVIGYDSMKIGSSCTGSLCVDQLKDVRLRMDGLFKMKEHAVHFVEEFMALYTNGPAGGGGISIGHKKEIFLQKAQVEREKVLWRTEARKLSTKTTSGRRREEDKESLPVTLKTNNLAMIMHTAPEPAPSGKKIPLYQAAHSRAGDKGNDLNFSIIPHFPGDLERLKQVITPEWVKGVVSMLLDFSSFSNSNSVKQRSEQLEQVCVEIFEVRGIHSLNVLVHNILDGGVNCSRRIDRHGKTVSDLILSQEIELPP